MERVEFLGPNSGGLTIEYAEIPHEPPSFVFAMSPLELGAKQFCCPPLAHLTLSVFRLNLAGCGWSALG